MYIGSHSCPDVKVMMVYSQDRCLRQGWYSIAIPQHRRNWPCTWHDGPEFCYSVLPLVTYRPWTHAGCVDLCCTCLIEWELAGEVIPFVRRCRTISKKVAALTKFSWRSSQASKQSMRSRGNAARSSRKAWHVCAQYTPVCLNCSDRSLLHACTQTGLH